jgi:hypothetical protein
MMTEIEGKNPLFCEQLCSYLMASVSDGQDYRHYLQNHTKFASLSIRFFAGPVSQLKQFVFDMFSCAAKLEEVQSKARTCFPLTTSLVLVVTLSESYDENTWHCLRGAAEVLLQLYAVAFPSFLLSLLAKKKICLTDQTVSARYVSMHDNTLEERH